MKVLHLFSNSKWTGPAEPALQLCATLRTLGVTADFACAPRASSGHNRVVASAHAQGIDPVLSMRLDKHRHPLYNLLDARRLRRLLLQAAYDIVHCHLDNDHQIAARALSGLGIPLVRSSYYGAGFPDNARFRRLLTNTGLLIEPSQRAAAQDKAAFGLSEPRLTVIPNAIDTERFNPERALPDMRARLGLSEKAFVIGIVARMQTHRRYEDLFAAFKELLEEAPEARLLIVGRGTKQASVAFRPAQALGLADKVIFPGYVQDDAYVGMLRAFDAGVFLVPGSDETCRAVREMLSLGIPVVAASRGMLPEIVLHKRTGLIVEPHATALYLGLARLYHHAEERAAFSIQARQHALRHFALNAQAQAVADAYHAVLAGIWSKLRSARSLLRIVCFLYPPGCYNPEELDASPLFAMKRMKVMKGKASKGKPQSSRKT